MSLFNHSQNYQPPRNQLDAMIEAVQANVNASGVASTGMSRAALGLESMNDSMRASINSTEDTLTTAMESIANELGLTKERAPTKAQINAAVAAGILAGDIKGFMSHNTNKPMVSTESMSVVTTMGLDDAGAVRPSMEAYDERENRQAPVFSMIYNMNAARQDEFCETFFPTITVTPDNVGFAVTVRLMMVYDEFTRNVSGALDKFNKKNILRAIADPTILKNESTRVIPVVRPSAVSNFVPAALIPPRLVDLEGEAILTAPLATGKKFSLIALSQPDTILANGVMDMTDTLDSAIELQKIYVQIGADIIGVTVSNLPLTTFTYSTQANYRQMTLNFDTTSVLVNKNNKNNDGSPLVDLVGITTNDLIVRLNITMSGTVNIETGETSVFGNYVAVHTVQNSAGEMVPLSAAPALDIVTAFETAKIIGYDLKCYRSNVNRRQRGQLIDTTNFTQLYNVPLRAPVTAIHPATMDGQTDSSDLSSLITVTRIRTSNAGVGMLINTAALLREYVDARDELGVGPDVMGVGRFFIRPQYHEETIDMALIVDSLKSHERAEDTQAALVNKIREYAYRMYRDSEYPVAADALCGGVAPIPTVIIGTDPYIARFLTVTGDLRTLGNEFNCKIVHTIDNRVSGKIFITFGVYDENRNVAPNPLNFGNMAWSPEITVVLPISRGGQISKELACSPRFLHLVNMPILAVLTINNIPQVTNKVPVLFKAV
jgi:hypothetical protein